MDLSRSSGIHRVAFMGALIMMSLSAGCAPQMDGPRPVAGESGRDTAIRIVPNQADRRVDILVGGDLFTAYIYPDPAQQTLKKPVLFPIMTAHGHYVTRGYPLQPRAGERVDHPHHVGLWFTFGDINGLDFWDYSDATPLDDLPHMGTIQHRETLTTQGNELEVTMDWVKPDGKTLLREDTRFVFQAGANLRIIDRITTLTAVDERAVFNDTKEGMTGLRVARALEHPTDEPLRLTNAAGVVTEVASMDNDGVTGEYLTSEGLTGKDAWGTRAHWVALQGTVEGEAVTVAIFDHPENPGHPGYWHARTYGLFTANPFGRHMFTDGAEEPLDFAIEPGETTTFRYRYLIRSGETTADQLEAAYLQFVAESARP